MIAWVVALKIGIAAGVSIHTSGDVVYETEDECQAWISEETSKITINAPYVEWACETIEVGE